MNAILATVTNPFPKLPTDIERLRAYISLLDGQREDQVHHVVAFKGGQVLLERTDPLWTQSLIYAFAASGTPQTIWYLGHSGNPRNRLQPSLDGKSFSHQQFAGACLLDPDLQVHVFAVKRMYSERKLIPYFNPVLNKDANSVYAALCEFEKRLAIIDEILAVGECTQSHLQLVANGYAKTREFACLLDRMGWINRWQTTRSNVPTWLHAPTARLVKVRSNLQSAIWWRG